MALDINSVTLIGRLTRDCELKYMTSGTAVCKFPIAVNRFKDEVSFIDIVLYGKQGESINKYLVKGKAVAISGELRQDRWTTTDGQNRSRVEVVANNIQLLGSGNQKSEDSSDDIPF